MLSTMLGQVVLIPAGPGLI